MVMLNGLTIIVYLKDRSLCKRSMYLVINQAVADMFVGASVFILCCFLGIMCDFWTINLPRHMDFFIVILRTGSPIASLINLGAISLERTHATFRPFKHRLIKKKSFGAAAAIVWITAGAITAGIVSQMTFQPSKDSTSDLSHSEGFHIFLISYLLCFLFCLLTIIVSYSSMAIKIVYGTQPYHRSATSRGRKLTKTLFIVTVVSLLLTLPFIIIGFYCEIFQLCTSVPFHFDLSFHFMFHANSLVNPVLYTVRMPEFKRALISFLHVRSQP